jgi:hypothetical protein
MKIAIIGAGNIGGTLGRHWIQAGCEVRFGVRDAAKIQPLLDELGKHAGALSPVASAQWGEAVVFAGPYGAWPAFAHEAEGVLAGKVVIDAANPYGERDGAIVAEIAASDLGSAEYTARLLPGAHVVKAFNTIYWLDLRDKAYLPGEMLAMPIAGDDAAAVATAATLAREAGFDPVIVGTLAEGKALDPGSPIYAKSFTAAQVRAALALPN